MTLKSNSTTLSFGRYLQAIRIEKGISIEEVAEETKIRQDILVKIEDEDFCCLPDVAFMKGFLNAYAEAIDADGEEAINRYMSRLKVIRKIAKSEADLISFSKKYWSRIIWSCLILLGLIFTTVYGLSYFRSPPEHSTSNTKDSSEKADQNDFSEPATSNNQPSEVINSKDVSDKYYLKLKTIEETWIKITVDESEPVEYNLNAGDYMELEAKNKFNLLIGNAGGVDITLNGQPMKVPGESGQVIRLRIP